MHQLIHSLVFSEYGKSESTVFSLLLFQEQQKLSPVGWSSFVVTANVPSVVEGNFLRNLGIFFTHILPLHLYTQSYTFKE